MNGTSLTTLSANKPSEHNQQTRERGASAISPLLCELARVYRRLLQHAELCAAAEALGLFNAGLPIGWDLVEPLQGGDHYAPHADGQPAFIVPVFENGKLVDLTATSLMTRRTLTRDGMACILGRDAIDRAMVHQTYVFLFQDPFAWLRNRGLGCVVLDWNAARFALSDLPGIACANELLAKRVENALRRPLPVPQIFIREGTRLAAA
jgi:hypothetical protein